MCVVQADVVGVGREVDEWEEECEALEDVGQGGGVEEWVGKDCGVEARFGRSVGVDEG